MKDKKSKLDIIEIANTAFDAVNESRLGPIYIDGDRKQASVVAVQMLQTVIQSLMEQE